MPNGEPGAIDPTQSEYLTFGGLAVVEGVMMRSPHHYAVACRAPNGNIVIKTEALESTWLGRQKWLKLPFLRGTLALLDTSVLGYKAMNWSADVQTRADLSDGTPQGKPVSKTVENALIIAAVVGGLLLQFVIFRATPEFIAEYLVRWATGQPDKNLHLTGTNYIAEVIKVVFFLGFLVLISRFPTTMELFRYHGAEHKAINTIEHRQQLTPENCAAQTRLHPRCGTNFLIIITAIAFLVFPLIPRDLFVPADSPSWKIALSRVPLQLVVLPLLAGISYEVIRLAGKARDQRWVNIILKPGLLTQLITTAEPGPKHIEVAIASLKAVIKAEESGHMTVSDDYTEEEPGAEIA